jgi:hypothetical protein
MVSTRVSKVAMVNFAFCGDLQCDMPCPELPTDADYGCGAMAKSGDCSAQAGALKDGA